MKKCIIFGNCQHAWLEKYLQLTPFAEEYQILPTLDVYCKNKMNLDSESLNSCSLFIYQHVNDEYDEFFSSNNIIRQLKDDCIKICIPNFYFSGYFPQISKALYERKNKKYSISPAGIMVYGDRNIENLLIQGKTSIDISKKLNELNFYKEEDVLKNIEINLNNLKNREKIHNVTFPCVNWINENYKKFKICVSVNHPCNSYYIWLVKEILQYLNIDYDNKKLDLIDLKAHEDHLETPIYPSVAEHLKLEFNTNVNTIFYDEKISFNQYIQNYIDYCTGKEVKGKCNDIYQSEEKNSCKVLPCIESALYAHNIGQHKKFLKDIPVSDNNYIIYKDTLLTIPPKTEYTKIPGLKVNLRGKNNIVILKDSSFTNSIISLENNSLIKIGSNCVFDGLIISNRFHNFGEVLIDNNVIAGEGLKINLYGNNKVSIGENSIFARNCEILCSDGHSILDLEGNLLNNNADVTIGNHCWIGNGAIIIKASLANDTIVGARSVVVKSFDIPNIVIAGNPAKIIKNNVTFDIRNPQYLMYNR